jgi:hypothetical protein
MELMSIDDENMDKYVTQQLEGPPLTSIERIMFFLLNHLNLQG